MINRVVLVGRLTKDVEVRKTQSGLSMARFTVACDRRFSRAQDQGGNNATADFISCVAFRQTADFLGNYARKGAMVGVEGRIQTGSYDRDGQRVYTTDVVCDNVQLLESKSQSQARAQSSGYQDNYQSSYSQPNYSQSSYQQPSYQQPSYNANSNSQGGYQSGYQDNAGFGADDGFGNGQGLDISTDDLPF
jgi:single-strand DNA-binding protein